MTTTIGSLTVYAGPMYAGKTTALIAELEAGIEEAKRVLVIKPAIDNRYEANDVVSHDGISLRTTTGHTVQRLGVDQTIALEALLEVDLLLIDEAQFFTNLAASIQSYLLAGVDVVAVGLDMDSEGKPFGCMPQLLAMANVVYKLSGICHLCAADATRTFRKLGVSSSEQVLIGGEETYEPRCHMHWLEGQREKRLWLS